jgi:hypothetical protein
MSSSVVYCATRSLSANGSWAAACAMNVSTNAPIVPRCAATGEIGSSEHHLHCRRPIRRQVADVGKPRDPLPRFGRESGAAHWALSACRSRATAHRPDCLQCSCGMVPGKRPEGARGEREPGRVQQTHASVYQFDHVRPRRPKRSSLLCAAVEYVPVVKLDGQAFVVKAVTATNRADASQGRWSGIISGSTPPTHSTPHTHTHTHTHAFRTFLRHRSMPGEDNRPTRGHYGPGGVRDRGRSGGMRGTWDAPPGAE